MSPRIAFVLGSLSALAILALAGLVVISSGGVEVSAIESHGGPVVYLLETARSRSIESRIGGIEVPPLDEPALAGRGLTLYREHCAVCHGGPGVAAAPLALGLNPPPPELVYSEVDGEQEAAEAFWVVSNGIRMTGMPGFGLALDEDEIWSLVALLRQLPAMTPEAYAPPAQDAGVAGAAAPESPEPG